MDIQYDTIKFDSIYDLARHVDHLQTNNVTRPYGDNSTDEGWGSGDFYQWPMDDSIKNGLNGGGWQEGADAMPRIHVPHETLSGHKLDEPTIESDVCGFAPDVGGYLANTPECMFTQVAAPTSERLLKVAVHVGRYQGCEQQTILNRGAAIMAVLDQLSREGYAIELHAIWRNADEGRGASVETIVKHSGDPWAPESVAYALCHASFQRRLCWRVAESLTNGGAIVTGEGYGNGTDARFDDFDLSYGYVLSNNERKMTTPKKAVAYIKEQTLNQLALLDKKAVAA